MLAGNHDQQRIVQTAGKRVDIRFVAGQGGQHSILFWQVFKGIAHILNLQRAAGIFQDDGIAGIRLPEADHGANHADNFTIHIEQRAAAVSGLDRDRGLTAVAVV